jgi:hypothetical protein
VLPLSSERERELYIESAMQPEMTVLESRVSGGGNAHTRT